jgi:uncharacterized protein YbjT (DUF2867 family)
MNVSFELLSRNSDQADLMANLSQAETVVGDLSDNESLVQALQGLKKHFC